MIRSTLEPDCPNVMLLATPSGRLSFQYRRADAETTYGVYTPPDTIELPHWVRLTRHGNHFTAQHSTDGAKWQDVQDAGGQPATIEIPMDETVHIGLAVTPHDVTRTAEARCSHVSTTGDVSPSGPFTESQVIPRRAGLARCKDAFKVLRSNCETDRAQEHPQYVVSAWIGHDIRVSARHCLQVPEELCEKVAGTEKPQTATKTAKNEAVGYTQQSDRDRK